MRLTLARLVGVLTPLPILIACASAGADNANVITAPQLGPGTRGTAYDAIRRIRPEMLRSRDPGTLVYFKASQPLVAVDNTVLGGVEVLRHLPAGQVGRVEFLNARAAAKRYGPGFGNGIVLIETRADSA